MLRNHQFLPGTERENSCYRTEGQGLRKERGAKIMLYYATIPNGSLRLNKVFSISVTIERWKDRLIADHGYHHYLEIYSCVCGST